MISSSDQNGTNAMNINASSATNNNTARNTVVDFSVGSMPANYGYDESFKEDEDDESNEESSLSKPRILIMGLRK